MAARGPVAAAEREDVPGAARLDFVDARLPLERLFDGAAAKVLDFFLSNEGLKYTDWEVSELAAVGEADLAGVLEALSAKKC